MAPTSRNRPRPLKSRVVLEATADSPKNTAAVPPAASMMSCAPFFSPRICWKSGPRSRPMNSVKPSSSATPSPLSRLRSIAKIQP